MTVTQSPTNSETRKALEHVSPGVPEVGTGRTGGEAVLLFMDGCIQSLLWDDGAETKCEAQALLFCGML